MSFGRTSYFGTLSKKTLLVVMNLLMLSVDLIEIAKLTFLDTNLVKSRFSPTCWLSLNNSETVKAVNLVFCSIK